LWFLWRGPNGRAEADFLQFRFGIPPDDERVFDTPDSEQRQGGPERVVELDGNIVSIS